MKNTDALATKVLGCSSMSSKEWKLTSKLKFSNKIDPRYAKGIFWWWGHFSTNLAPCHYFNTSIYSYYDFGLKNGSFRLPYQRPSSSVSCTSELFKGSNGSASLVDCTQKHFLVGGCRFFVTDIISEVVLGRVAWPRAQPLGQSFSLKFSFETRFKSKFF